MQRESLPAGIWKKASLPRSPLTLLLSSSRDRNLSSHHTMCWCAGATAGRAARPRASWAGTTTDSVRNPSKPPGSRVT
ncbi:hypothetical protein DIPPA_11113 [Diplonema papillatum]|nr:hypothetical protein DIPPA_11113 [Diplonema papillatum]